MVDTLSVAGDKGIFGMAALVAEAVGITPVWGVLVNMPVEDKVLCFLLAVPGAVAIAAFCAVSLDNNVVVDGVNVRVDSVDGVMAMVAPVF